MVRLEFKFTIRTLRGVAAPVRVLTKATLLRVELAAVCTVVVSVKAVVFVFKVVHSDTVKSVVTANSVLSPRARVKPSRAATVALVGVLAQ